MKNLPLRLLATIAFAGMPLDALSNPAEELEDRYGRLIKAELVSHEGLRSAKIKIARDGKAFDLDISTLSENSQKQVREWIKTNPALGPKIKLEVSASKKRLAEDTYVYDLAIKNQTGWDAEKLRVEYRVFAKDSRGQVVSRDGTHKLRAPLPRRESTNFRTKRFDPDIKIVKTSSGSVSVSGRSSADKGPRGAARLVGVLVRVFDEHGTQLVDWRSPGSFPGEWGT